MESNLSSGNTKRYRRSDASRNRTVILGAAHTVFRDRGGRMTLLDVAREAGLAVSTVHRHFPRREDLLRSVAATHFARGIAAVATESVGYSDGRSPSPLSVLREMLADLFDSALAMVDARREEFPTLPVDVVQRAALVGAGRNQEVLARLLQRAQDACEVRPDLTVEDLVRLMVMLVAVLGTGRPRDVAEGHDRYLLLVDSALTAPQGHLSRYSPPLTMSFESDDQ